MNKIAGFVFVMMLLITPPSFAMERFDIVTTEEMKQMLDDRALDKIDFIMVNGLDEIIFRDQSIPGSINVPWSEVYQMAGRLGNDKDKLIITY